MKFFWAIALLLMLALCGCDSCQNNLGPTDLPTAEEENDVPPLDPIRADTKPDLRQVVGVSAFALALRDEYYIRYYVDRVQEHGYNSIRVLAKTDGWLDNKLEWLPPGPPMGGGAEENLKRLLRVTSEYPNFWLELVACATERDDHEQCIEWTRKVSNMAKKYKHIYLSAMNEPQMSNWTIGELNELLDILRKSGRQVGVDQPTGGGNWKFNPGLRVDFRAVHPPRNVGWGLRDIQTVVRINGLTLFDETTCYVSDEDLVRFPGMRNNDLFYLNGTGTEKERKRAQKQDMENYRKVRSARWFAHSIAGIACDRLDFHLPRWR